MQQCHIVQQQGRKITRFKASNLINKNNDNDDGDGDNDDDDNDNDNNNNQCEVDHKSSIIFDES